MIKHNDFKKTIEVCCHRVSVWYDLEDVELSDELEERLEEEAEERTKSCIIEGYVAGELCYYHYDENDKMTFFRGWWEIQR